MQHDKKVYSLATRLNDLLPVLTLCIYGYCYFEMGLAQQAPYRSVSETAHATIGIFTGMTIFHAVVACTEWNLRGHVRHVGVYDSSYHRHRPLKMVVFVCVSVGLCLCLCMTVFVKAIPRKLPDFMKLFILFLLHDTPRYFFSKCL